MTEPLDYRKVPRYSIVGGIHWPACSGDWVKWSHYQVLLAAYEALTGATAKPMDDVIVELEAANRLEGRSRKSGGNSR